MGAGGGEGGRPRSGVAAETGSIALNYPAEPVRPKPAWEIKNYTGVRRVLLPIMLLSFVLR